MPIPERTIRDWRIEHADEYDRLEATRDDWTAEWLANHSEALAGLMGQIELQYALHLLSRSDAELRKLSPNVVASAMSKATVSRGISIDKANDLRKRPTRPSGDIMGFDEVMRTLAAKFPNVIKINPALIEGTAEEIEEED